MAITKNNKIEASDITTSLEAVNTKVTAVDNKLGNYLPLSGGTLTGPLYLSSILQGTKNSELGFYGGDAWRDGAYIELKGPQANYPNVLSMCGADGSLLQGLSDGWKINGNLILTSAGGTMTGPLSMNTYFLDVTSRGNSSLGARNDAGLGAKAYFFPNDMPGYEGVFIIDTGTIDGEYHRLRGQGKNLTWDSSLILTLVASWCSGTNWYRKWSDGWIEQGGTTQNVGADSTVTVSCHTPFTTTNYNIVASQKSNGTKTDSTGMVLLYPTSTSSWRLHNGDNVSAPFMWYACGY